MKVLMLKGLPGSGKSTWAKEFVAQNHDWVRVNKDTIRDMIGYQQKKEHFVLRLRDHCVMAALDAGLNVVVDDTNLHPKHEQRLFVIAKQQNADFETKFFDTPLEECIKNDLNRPVSVGEKVIKKMWRDFLYQKYEAPKLSPDLPFAVICDLDGTLAIHDGRSPYDTEKCGTDKLSWAVYFIIKHAREQGFNIIFVSGREDRFRDQTVQWLSKTDFVDGNYRLFMRPTGDFRKDDIVKEEIYLTQIMGKFNVEFVLDDRNRVVDMWRRNGLTCLQVAEGDF